MLSVQYVHFTLIHGGGNRSVEIDFDLSFLSLFGSNDDHAVRCTRTVDRSGCGIFQNLNGFNIITIQFVHTGFGRNTVDYIKRVVIVQRTDTADTYGSRSTRITIGGDVHSGDTSLKGFHRIVFTLLLDFVYFYYRNSTCQVGFTLCSITCYDNFIYHLGIFFQ